MKPLTEPEKRRKNAALTIVKTLSEETSVVAKPLSKIDVKNIPNRVEPAIKNWIRRYKGNSEIYGSAAMATHSIHARRPGDLDIVVDNPKHVALSLSGIITKKGFKVKLVVDKQWNSYVIQIKNRKGNWVDAIDIHPIQEHHGKFEFYGSSKPPLKKKGINLQRAADQLLRKANAITQRKKDDSMGAAPHRELKDTTDFITTAELLVASMELKSAAEKARAKKLRDAIKIWKQHLRTLQSSSAKTKRQLPKRKPLSETRKKHFVRKAVKNPTTDIDDLIFENGRVIKREVPISKAKPKRKAKSPYDKPKKKAKQPYAKSPYKFKQPKKMKDDLLDLIDKELGVG